MSSEEDNDFIESENNNDSENSNKKNNSKKKKSVWKSEQEDILKVWADKALCYKSMHDRSTKKFWCLNAWFNIPIIILSTLTGTGNFAQGSFDPAYKDMLILFIGGANILAALLGTIAQYINVSGTLEGHRFASISWDKYARGIQVELGKVRTDRQDPHAYVKRCQEDFDRLIEISPDFSSDVINWFNKLINTGEFIEDSQCCGVFCYECFCLPFGCRGCGKVNICCKWCPEMCQTVDGEKESKKKNFKDNWTNIELPEVLGRIKPTNIVRDEEHIQKENRYRIDNFNDIDV